jgi:hypothetical protein
MVIWALIGVIVIAVLAYIAFQGTTNMDENLENAATSTAEAVNQASVRAEAAAELTALRVRAEAGETYDELQSDFADVRARLAAGYENAEGEAAAEWRELRADFDSFEATARENTSDFLNALNDLIANISADVRTETEAE